MENKRNGVFQNYDINFLSKKPYLESKYFLFNGNIEGLCEKYRSNGSIFVTCYYINNIENGIYRYTSYISNGNKIRTHIAINGIIVDEKCYY
jgi:antitoxin component YwqK of YwqJK toxin-antitoxin module